jgi:hypothetical protein
MKGSPLFRSGFDLDVAAMISDDRVRNRKRQAAFILFARKIRITYLLEELRWDAGAAVRNRDPDIPAPG